MLVAWWVSMGKNQIRMDTDSDISDNHICVFFQFPSLRMETDRIRTDTNSDISDIFEYLFFCLLTVFISNGGGIRWIGSSCSSRAAACCNPDDRAPERAEPTGSARQRAVRCGGAARAARRVPAGECARTS